MSRVSVVTKSSHLHETGIGGVLFWRKQVIGFKVTTREDSVYALIADSLQRTLSIARERSIAHTRQILRVEISMYDYYEAMVIVAIVHHLRKQGAKTIPHYAWKNATLKLTINPLEPALGIRTTDHGWLTDLTRNRLLLDLYNANQIAGSGSVYTIGADHAEAVAIRQQLDEHTGRHLHRFLAKPEQDNPEFWIPLMSWLSHGPALVHYPAWNKIEANFKVHLTDKHYVDSRSKAASELLLGHIKNRPRMEKRCQDTIPTM